MSLVYAALRPPGQDPPPPAPTAPPRPEGLQIDPDQLRELIREAQEAAREAAVEAQAEVAVAAFPEPPMPPEYELGIIIVISICAMIFLVAIGWPIARAIARRLDRTTAQPQLTPPLDARFQRLEQAVEAVAIEVERISEAQRYSAKLLSERLPASLAHRGEGA